MNEVESAWLAGLIEGEGFLSIKQGRNPLLGINMTDLDVLERAQQVSGYGTITARRKEKDHHREQWGWRVCTQPHVNEICLAIYPHMGSRRRARIDEVLALPLREPNPRWAFTGEVQAEAERLLGMGMSHAEVARRTGVSRTTVGRYVRSRRMR